MTTNGRFEGHVMSVSQAELVVDVTESRPAAWEVNPTGNRQGKPSGGEMGGLRGIS